jgi:23S rRNA (guanosine2251-2'-O)-methyltransferase
VVRQSGEIVAGRNPVTEALKAGRVQRLLMSETAVRDRVIKTLLERAQEARIVPERVDAAQLDRLAPGVTHQGVVAICEPRTYWTLDEVLARAKERGEDPFLLLLDGVEDPHNLGAVLRVADGAGAHGVVIPSRGATGLTPTVFKASAGAAEHVPVAQVGNLTDAVLHLKRAEVWVGIAEANEGKAYYDERLTGPLALVLGSEGSGVSRPVAKHADFAVHIPLKGGVSSLNVSVATAILAFERVRQLAHRKRK